MSHIHSSSYDDICDGHQVDDHSTGTPITACADITLQHSPNSPSTYPQPCYKLYTAINGVPVGPLTESVVYSSSSEVSTGSLEVKV